jgi:hypothetical protein
MSIGSHILALLSKHWWLYCTLSEMKTRFTDLHAKTALGLQLVPSIIENIAP